MRYLVGEAVIGLDEDTDALEDCVGTRRTVLQVELCALEGPNPGVKVVFKGSITLDSKDVLTAQPAKREDIHLFRNVLAEPIRVFLPGMMTAR